LESRVTLGKSALKGSFFGQKAALADRYFVPSALQRRSGRKAVAPAPICGQQIGQMRI
jgi:hypothetical protein